MSENAQPLEPEQPPAAPKTTVAQRWHRVALYTGSIAVVLALWICGILFMIRFHPARFVNGLQSRLPFQSSVGRVFWVNRRTLEIDDVKLSDFFYARSIIITASPIGLLRRHVAKVQLLYPQVFTKALYAEMDKDHGTDDAGLNWTIGRLEVSHGTLVLDNFAIDTPVTVRLGVRSPIVLNGLRLGKPDASPGMNEPRTMEIVNVNIVSPWDPTSPVLSLPLTKLRFTYAELWHHRIRSVELIRPTLHLGEDLFWFTSQFRQERRALPMVGPSAPWQVGHFQVDYGRLAVNAFGQPVFHFPFYFQTQVDNIRLDQLDQISSRSTIPISQLTQDYPDYKVRIVNLTGNLYFSWPPTDASANNVVNTLKVDEISWNDIPVKAVNSNVTFDPNGVYGKLNGTCEGGQLSGNFEFYYTKGFTWNADFFAQKVNLQPIAEKMGGKYVDLTGELDGNLDVEGKVTDIQVCRGSLTLPHPGVLQIKSMDDLLKRLPPDLSAIKRDLAKLAISNFQTYPYQNGQLKIDYKDKSGVGTLKLASPLGKRDFSIYWHPYESSKVAKNADNQ